MSGTDHLHAVAAAFRATMPADGNVSVFRIDDLDRIGIPVVQANLIQSNEPATTGHGYGFTAIEAEVGALGELCEEVHVAAWVKHAPRVTASYNELLRDHGVRGVADPLTLCLPAGSSYIPDMRLTWVKAKRWPTDETVFVPRDWVAAYPYQLGEQPQLITPITNGLGAGFDYGHAIAHGLMELLQRDGNVVNYRALDRGVVVSPDGVDDPEVAGLLHHLRQLGIDVSIKLASTEFGISNIYVVGDDRGTPTMPIQVTSCGEAAHPDRARSLRKALLEFCGSRSRKAATHGSIEQVRRVMPNDHVEQQITTAMLEEEENHALEAMAEWIVQDATELRQRLSSNMFLQCRQVHLSDLPDAGPTSVADPIARLHWLTERLHAERLEVLWIDCSPPGTPVKVVKTIVPGLESETLSYHRIGWRGVRRLRDLADKLVLDMPQEGAARVLLRPDDEAKCGGAAWFSVTLARRLVDKLYPLYRECGPFAAQLLLQRQNERV